jgi:hypothetical protein
MAREIAAIAAIVAVISAIATWLASERWPNLTIAQILSRVLNFLTLTTVLLMVVGCGLIFRTECAPDDRVCDGPAMAAAGVTLLGATILAAVVVIGLPVGYILLRLLRDR